MLSSRPAATLVALALALLLGCGPAGRTASPTATPSPRATAATNQAKEKTSGQGQASARRPSERPDPATAPPGSIPSRRIPVTPGVQVPPEWPRVEVQPVVNGLNKPLYVTHAGDGSPRLFVVEKGGRIMVVRDGALLPTPFLDLTPLVKSAGTEQGLFSVAFHPRYAENGFFYVDYTDHNGHSVIARYRVSVQNPDLADPNSVVPVLFQEQPFPNHNGGLLVFGPDGYLYVGFGDGGSGSDPFGNGQNRSVLLGKLLRLDVDNGLPYAIPPDNPFVHEPGARPEIWAYGFRNPWRYSFDRATGDLYIADVGQKEYEEVDFQRAGVSGQNYGWGVTEGRHCYPRDKPCDASPFVQPIGEYDHSLGCSITGGYVYRGPSFPQLAGIYFFGDYCSGRIWGLRGSASGVPGDWRQQQLLQSSLQISSFGEDEVGELYLTSLSDGGLYRLVAAP